jgi:phosphatidylserine/phosphatidylglycerophosphate/cardiolipin synthase-like enzyme
MPAHFLAGMAGEGSLAQTIFYAEVIARTGLWKSSCRIVRLLEWEYSVIRSWFAQIRFLPVQQHKIAALDLVRFCQKVRLSIVWLYKYPVQLRPYPLPDSAETMTRLMKTILLPLILALAYFGASAKTGDTVDRLFDQVLDRTGNLLRGAGGKARVNDIPAGQAIDVAFSPDAGSEELVVKVIASARSNIGVAAYSFTSPVVAKALLNAKKRGVDVRVVVDENGNRSKASLAALNLIASAGIPTRTISRYAIHHDKYMVVDKVTVQTGSFNYSKAAAKSNSENVIVIWNNPDLALTYLKHWQDRYDQGRPYAPAY